jgi:hypothetical protein
MSFTAIHILRGMCLLYVEFGPLTSGKLAGRTGKSYGGSSDAEQASNTASKHHTWSMISVFARNENQTATWADLNPLLFSTVSSGSGGWQQSRRSSDTSRLAPHDLQKCGISHAQ